MCCKRSFSQSRQVVHVVKGRAFLVVIASQEKVDMIGGLQTETTFPLKQPLLKLWILIPCHLQNSNTVDFIILCHKMLLVTIPILSAGDYGLKQNWLGLSVTWDAEANKTTKLWFSWKRACLGFFKSFHGTFKLKKTLIMFSHQILSSQHKTCWVLLSTCEHNVNILQFLRTPLLI